MQRTEMADYQQTHDGFDWQIPETFNFGTDVVDYWAQDPEKMAMIWVDDKGSERRFSFADIRDRSNQLANVLSDKGVKKGDYVIVMLPRIPEWQMAMVACHKLGAVPIPCITMQTEKDIAYRAAHAGAKAAITTADNSEKFSDAFTVRIRVGGEGHEHGWTDFDTACDAASSLFEAAIMQAEDPAVLYYTSGSTGLPKGVHHAARALFTWRVSAWYWLTATETDVMWCTADTGWSKAGTSILYGPWSCGTCILFYDGPFEPEARFDLLEKYNVTIFCAAATELRQLIHLDVTGRAFDKLRLTVSAGESVNPDVVRNWRAMTGSLLLDGYGQTETLMTIVNYPCLPVKPGSMGKPLPGTDMAVLADDGSLAKAGETGQLVIKLPNPQIMLGYLNDEKRTQETRIRVGGEPWFITGDSVYQDEDGYIFYDGRDDDIINSAGYRIGPMEVENAMMEHKAVSECAAVASPDAERGEVVKAFIILADGFTASDALVADIQNTVKRLTAPYKYPRKITFLTELPKTITGKIRRKVLKELEFKEEQNPNV